MNNERSKRKRTIHPLRMFFEILHQTRTYKILIGYIVAVFCMALLMYMVI